MIDAPPFGLKWSNASHPGETIRLSAAITLPETLEFHRQGDEGADHSVAERRMFGGAVSYYSYCSSGFVTAPHQFTGSTISVSVNRSTSLREVDSEIIDGSIGSGWNRDSEFTFSLCLTSGVSLGLVQAMRAQIRNKQQSGVFLDSGKIAYPRYVNLDFEISAIAFDDVTASRFFTVNSVSAGKIIY